MEEESTTIVQSVYFSFIKMISSQTPPKIAKFSDMDVRVGHRVQLIVPGPFPQKHYTQVIGYLEGEFVILHLPPEYGDTLHLHEGQHIDIRLFSRLSIYTFSGRVNSIMLNPKNFLLLSFPQEVQEYQMRSHERVNVDVPVQVMSAGESPVARQGMRLRDISNGGASLLGPALPERVGDALKLVIGFHQSTTGRQEEVALMSTLRSVERVPATPDSVETYRYGVQFNEVDPRVALWVYELGA
jgi:c-di-GMP-binding flagellar brake protein YcgR